MAELISQLPYDSYCPLLLLIILFYFLLHLPIFFLTLSVSVLLKVPIFSSNLLLEGAVWRPLSDNLSAG